MWKELFFARFTWMVTNSTSFSICSFSQFISVAIMQGLVIKNKILDMRYGRCFSTFKLFLKIFLPMVILAFKTTTSRASGIIKYTFFTPVYMCFLLQMICQGFFLKTNFSARQNDCFMPRSYSWVSGKNLAGINLIPLTSCWQTHQKGWKRCHNLWLCKYLNQDCSEANCRADDNVALLYYINNRFDRWIWMLIFCE